MPRRPRRRKYRRKKKRNSLNITKFSRLPFPKIFTTKMRSSGMFDLDCSATSLASDWIRANSLYQITSSGTGHYQPYGWDQLNELYTTYAVLGSKIKVRFVRQVDTDTDVDLSIVGCYLSDTATPSATKSEDIIMRPGVTSAPLYPEKGEVTITKYYSAKKFMGRSPYSDAQQHGEGGNVTHGAFFNVFQTTMDSSSTANPALIRVLFDVEYIVRWMEPKELAASVQ